MHLSKSKKYGWFIASQQIAGTEVSRLMLSSTVAPKECLRLERRQDDRRPTEPKGRQHPPGAALLGDDADANAG